MKKVFLLSLILAVGMTIFAQTKNQAIKAPKLKVGTADIYQKAQGKQEAVQAYQYLPSTSIASTRFELLDEYAAMMTNYDLQSNGFVANRMTRFADGSVGVTATWDYSGSSSFPDRGTGYNIYLSANDDLLYPDGPESRIEQEKTGWPSYAQWGADGEIVVSHTGTGLVCYTREKKAEGEWTRHEIPNPDLGLPAQEMTWARVITSGANHDVIHVIAADQDSDVLADTYLYYCRSTDGGENWTVGLAPALDDSEKAAFGSDYYALAANGNTVAILLVGDIMTNSYVIKSDDNGENWNKITVWENPYAGLDWENDPASLFGDDNPMYGPETGAICIDNNGMVHCAYSTHHYYHAELGTSYNFYYGMSVDGIFYWNEDMGQIVDEGWTCPDDGTVIEPNGHNAFRMWWPTDAAGDYITRNFTTTLCGFINPEYTADWNNDNFYYEDYYGYWQGASALPSICIDESGAVAIAFSCPDPSRGLYDEMYYYRGVFMSYIDYPYTIGDHYGEWTETPGSYYYNEEYLLGDFMHSMDECIGVSSIQNTTDMEFWLSFQADAMPGLGVGNSATQGGLTDNVIYMMKVVPNAPELSTNEAVNPMTAVRVYPNPVQDVLNLEVNASQASEMNIAVYNITGQKVMETSANVNAGINTPSINVSSLNSGIYFVTVKANGFENTMKFVVK